MNVDSEMDTYSDMKYEILVQKHTIQTNLITKCAAGADTKS